MGERSINSNEIGTVKLQGDLSRSQKRCRSE
jgi:hypothetical protein